MKSILERQKQESAKDYVLRVLIHNIVNTELVPGERLIDQEICGQLGVPDTGSFTLAYFTKFFSKSYYFDTLINSFKVSITATVLSIAIGTPLAYLFTIFKIKGKSVLNILIVGKAHH